MAAIVGDVEAALARLERVVLARLDEIEARLTTAGDDEPALVGPATPAQDAMRDTGEPLTPTELARRWGASLCRSITPAIRRGEIRVVPWGKRQRIPMDEVHKLEREGYAVRTKQSRRKKRKETAVPADFDQQLARTRSRSYEEILKCAADRRRAGN